MRVEQQRVRLEGRELDLLRLDPPGAGPRA
jgi:hypothetical protein